MPPISVHFALGVAAAALVAPRFSRPGDRAAVAVGLVAGAVVPDLDLIPSSLSFLVTFTTETGKLIHRTFTHSYPVIALLLLGGMALAASAGANHRRRAIGLGVAAAAASDAVLHVAPDSAYLVGVKLLFPFSMEEFFFGPLSKDRFTDTGNNVINGIDFLSESAVWVFTAWLATRYGTENRFTRMLPKLALANAVLYLVITVAFASRVSYDTFLIILYSPGIVNIVISTALVPWLARDTWARLGGGVLPAREPAAPIPARV